jgi:hypothetical protein
MKLPRLKTDKTNLRPPSTGMHDFRFDSVQQCLPTNNTHNVHTVCILPHVCLTSWIAYVARYQPMILFILKPPCRQYNGPRDTRHTRRVPIRLPPQARQKNGQADPPPSINILLRVLLRELSKRSIVMWYHSYVQYCIII